MHPVKRGELPEDIAAMIKSQICCHLGHTIQGLHVGVRNDHVVISGRAPSFYAKQLAQHVAINASPLPVVNVNEIEVG